MFDILEFTKKTEISLSTSGVLHRAGGILYSGAHTLRKGDIYVLGVNPGGTSGLPIGEDLASLPSKTRNNYLDEVWCGTCEGGAPLQRRIRKLVECTGRNLRDVCASNLIFMQSPDITGISIERDGDLCWPVHERILAVVQPKLIIAFGNSTHSPYRYMFKRFNRDGRQDVLESNHGLWKCRGFTMDNDGRKVYVAGFPHLSRYSPLDHDGAVRKHLAEWINNALIN